MNLVQQIEAQYEKEKPPEIHVGDTVKVHIKIVEGEKERVQIVEGVILRICGGGVRKTFTVRKISFGVGVERIFPLHSPRVEKIEVVKRAKVRQAKLYYLRELKGKAARLKELKKTGTSPSKKKKKATKKTAAKKAAVKKAIANKTSKS